jgi:N-acetylmuramoyl-L-alanine amidase
VNATDRQELQARVNVGAYTPGMQVFLSIHCNAFSSPSANGTETFYYPRSDTDALLAQDLQDALVAANGLHDRGISDANFYVVKHSSVPSALVELAFISNYNEEGLLASPDFQDKLALAIARGLGKFFQDSGI